ncbi:MAG TPA: PAS domain-containing protein, partial [Spirochaetota bacterium]|nr:PAS domain-containing protein [Spirochaetota bacterium]
PSVLDLYGYSVKEFYDDPLLWQNMTHPDDLHIIEQTFAKLLESGVSERESRVIRKDGEVIWILDKSKFVYDQNKKPIRIDGMAIDITEKKKIELALIDSEKKLKEAQKIAQLGNWEYDLVNNKLFWSDEVYAIFECDPSKITTSYELFLSLIHPEDRDKIDKAYKDSLIDKKPYDVEHRIVTKNGSVKYLIEKCKTDFNEKGEPVKSSGVTLDITEKKRIELNLMFNELKYRTIINSANDAIIIADANTGYIVEANQSAEDLFKIPLERIIGLHQKDLHPKENEYHYVEAFRKVVNSNSNAFGESLIVDAFGEYIPVEISSTVIDIKDNKYVIGIFRDISLRKQNEARILEQNKDLKELNATKDKFFSIIAHDLKTPFNALIGFSELLLSDYETFTDDEKLKFIETISDTAKSSFQLLNNLLDWARSQSGKINYKKETINLKEIIDSVISIHKNVAKNKNIIIDNEIEDKIFAYADKNTIETVVRNLLSNAIKYSQKNSKVIVETIKPDNNDNNFVEICIEDKGVGMSSEQIEKLFSIENSFSTKGTNNEGGTGLGLILCK